MITIANQDNLRIDPIRDLSDMKIINDRIEYVRCNLGFPIEYLAIEIGVPKTMLMRCLGKKNLYPSNDVIGGILKKFPVSQQWLLSGIGNPFNERDIEPFIFWGGKRIMDHDFPVLLSQLNKRSKFNYQNEIGNELKLNKEN